MDFFKKYNHQFQVFFVMFDAFILVAGYLAARYFSFTQEDFFQITVKEVLTFFILMTVLFFISGKSRIPSKI